MPRKSIFAKPIDQECLKFYKFHYRNMQCCKKAEENTKANLFAIGGYHFALECNK